MKENQWTNNETMPSIRLFTVFCLSFSSTIINLLVQKNPTSNERFFFHRKNLFSD